MKNAHGHVAVIIMLLLTSTLFLLPVPQAAGAMNMDGGSAQASFMGYGLNHYIGREGSMDGGGDLNGDGYDDLAFGAVQSSTYGLEAGEAFVVFGNATGWTRNVNISNLAVSFRGQNTGDHTGSAVEMVGDVNGDGYDDLLVGADGRDDFGDHKDNAFLIFGKGSGWGDNVNISQANVTFNGEMLDDATGGELCGVGDVNGDGMPDMLISSERYLSGSVFVGKAYLVLGKRGTWNATYNLSDADASWVGTTDYYFLGKRAASAGDVNGDGFDDMLVMAERYNAPYTYGVAYIIMGKASGWAKNVAITSVTGKWEYMGLDSVGGSGDVNRDGYDDIMLGDIAFKNNSIWPGAANVTLGGPNAPALWGITQTYIGEFDNSVAGNAVSIVGDVDGDGFDDMVMADCRHGSEVGQVYLITGYSPMVAGTGELKDLLNKGSGEWSYDYYGTSIEPAGDVDGDGLDEFLVGASGNDEGGGGTDSGKAYLHSPVAGSVPSSISSVKAYNDLLFTKETDVINRSEKAYIELSGADADPSKPDSVLVRATSSSTSPIGLMVPLRETGSSTGKYRGDFTVKEYTNKDKRELGAGPGEKITVSSFNDPSKKAVLDIYGPTRLFPANDTLNATEDTPFSFRFWSYNWSDIVWTMQTGGDWLTFNSVTGNLSGTPNNGDVGISWVKLRAQNKFGLFDERNMTLNVNNTPPNITTPNVLTGTEHVYYRVDYNSTDDGNGPIGWHVKSDAPWLAMDVLTGVLNGTPGDNDTGPHWVNVSVDDGNGGKAWTNFTLTIGNVNDAPVIITEDQTWALEDVNYTVRYEAIDADGDVLTWAFETNATSWLAMDVSHVLKGRPASADLGSWWANVSVTDGKGGSDHHLFIINVSSTNDPPTITTTVDITKAFIGKEYSAQYNAVDPDPGDVLTWTVERDPVAAGWLTIDAATGLLHGTPGIQGYVGTNHVTVMVSDPYGGNDTRDFDLTVIANSPPEITSTPVVVATVGKPYNYNVEATDADGDVVVFSLVDAPDGMIIDATFGKITWTPKGNQVGQNTVTVKVSDDDFEVTQTFIIDVTMGGGNNKQPVIEPIGDKKVKPGEAVMFQVVATDKDNDALTYTLGNAPAGMTINDTGWVLWPDTGAKGSYVITVTVSDGMATVSESFTLVVDEGGGGDGGGGSNGLLLAGMLLVGLVVGIVLILVVVFVVVFLMMRKKGGGAYTAPPPAQLPPQYQNQQYPQPPPPQPQVQPQYQQPYQYPPGPQQ